MANIFLRSIHFVQRLTVWSPWGGKWEGRERQRNNKRTPSSPQVYNSISLMIKWYIEMSNNNEMPKPVLNDIGSILSSLLVFFLISLPNHAPGALLDVGVDCTLRIKTLQNTNCIWNQIYPTKNCVFTSKIAIFWWFYVSKEFQFFL